MSTDPRVVADAVTQTLQRLLPLRHGRFSIEVGSSVLEPAVTTEATLQDRDTETVETLRGVWVLLNAVTFDGDAVIDVQQQNVHIGGPDVDAERLTTFLEGWRAALPMLLDRYIPATTTLVPYMILDASLRSESAMTAADIEASLADPEGPMKSWWTYVRDIAGFDGT